MRRRKSLGLGKIGILALALVIMLGVMGVGYAAWSDEIDIAGIVNTGEWNDTLVEGLCWTSPAEQTDTYIDCWGLLDTSPDLPDPDQMALYIDNATSGVTYNCDFFIYNEGTIPTALQSIAVWASNDLSVTVLDLSTGMPLEPGTPIEPGESVSGTVSIELKASATPGWDYLTTVTFVTVRWNDYVPPE